MRFTFTDRVNPASRILKKLIVLQKKFYFVKMNLETYQ